jgi:UDP-3-O-[3-hydroxymyristoyl] glucosamine N-acyltransferase
VNYTLKKISEILDAELVGDDDFEINQVSSFENATNNSVVFFSDKKFLKHLESTKSQTVITKKSLSKYCKNNILICENPYLVFAKLSHILNKNNSLDYKTHKSVVCSSEKLNSKIQLEPNVVIGNDVNFSDNVFIGANSYIADNVHIGADSYIYPNVTIYKDVKIGSNVIIHSGSVIGSDGFGYANSEGEWVKIPQIGSVRIGNNVEIGSNTSIDRGTLDDTFIGNGVKIDNQIQIAHNVYIGDNTAIAGCVGIAGSAKIGKNCTIGGGAGIQGHIEICDNVQITGMTKVSCNIKEAGTYSSGTPIMSNKTWLKNAARFKQLNNLFIKYKKNIDKN